MKEQWSDINLPDMPDMPYIYQEISIDENRLYITYGVVGNHDFEVSLCKDYDVMKKSFLEFRAYTDEKDEKEWPILTDLRTERDKVQLEAQLDLIEKAINNQLDLPDKGIGFYLITDMDTLEYCRNGCLQALEKFI